MKYLYTVLALGFLASCAYLYYVAGIRTTSKVEQRYLACLESGKDGQTCVVEEMNLRALTTCPK